MATQRVGDGGAAGEEEDLAGGRQLSQESGRPGHAGGVPASEGLVEKERTQTRWVQRLRVGHAPGEPDLLHETTAEGDRNGPG